MQTTDQMLDAATNSDTTARSMRLVRPRSVGALTLGPTPRPARPPGRVLRDAGTHLGARDHRGVPAARRRQVPSRLTRHDHDGEEPVVPSD